MKNQIVEIKNLKMTKNVLNSIIELDKDFYQNFDYSDASWYLNRYNEKNEVSALVVDGKIVGYFLFVTISLRLLFQICDLKYAGDFYFPESELNANTKIFYLSSVLVKEDFRNYSPLLLRALFREFEKRETVVVITVSQTGKRMAEKFMSCMGNLNEKIFVFLKTKNPQLKKRLLIQGKNQ